MGRVRITIVITVPVVSTMVRDPVEWTVLSAHAAEDHQDPFDRARRRKGAPFCNGPGDVKSPRVMSRRRAHASVRGRRRGRHTMLSEGTVSLSRYAWFVG